jgi:hypothetical protein
MDDWKLDKAFSKRKVFVFNTPRRMILRDAKEEIKRLDAELGEG